MKRLNSNIGLSLIELIVTMIILSVLAAGVIPLSRTTSIRSKEIELRRNLRIIRVAIDDYKKTFDKMPDGPLKTGTGFPKSLNELIEGHDFGDAKIGTVKFLRRKVLNPLNKASASDENWGWGLRSYIDPPDSTSWGGDDVFDVYVPQEGTAIDGTKYNEW